MTDIRTVIGWVLVVLHQEGLMIVAVEELECFADFAQLHGGSVGKDRGVIRRFLSQRERERGHQRTPCGSRRIYTELKRYIALR